MPRVELSSDLRVVRYNGATIAAAQKRTRDTGGLMHGLHRNATFNDMVNTIERPDIGA